MKGFLRSKLTLTLAAFVMIVAAVAIPLAGSAIQSQSTHAATLLPGQPIRLQLPWPGGDQHRISGGFTYGCGDHTAPHDAFAIDFSLGLGDRVSAVAGGVAHAAASRDKAGNFIGFGRYVWISHANNFVSLYAHLSGYPKGIHQGDSFNVTRGAVIGFAGSTGNSTGPHLHFSLRSNATTQHDGASFKPEPMSGYVGFGIYGIHSPINNDPNNCHPNNPSPLFTSTPPHGELWLTGHDADFHCSHAISSPAPQCHYFQVAVNFVRNNSTRPKQPLLILDHVVSGGEVEKAIKNAFGATHVPMKIVDPRSAEFASLVLVTPKGNPVYSAIIVASDITCSGCDNNDALGVTPDSLALIMRESKIEEFFHDGGSILALAGAKNISVYYNFLPIPVTPLDVTPSDGHPGGFTLTSLGTELGLVDPGLGNASDINCCQTHNSFQAPSPTSGSPFQVVETDSAGNAETLVG